MILDAGTLPQGTSLEADLAIVGSGAAGMTLALEFAGRKERVILLEGGGIEGSEASQSLYRGQNVGVPYFPLDQCRSRQLGGSTNCWGGYCRIFDELDFEPRARIPHSGWALSLADIMPWYEKAHDLCRLPSLDYRQEAWAARDRERLCNPFSGSDAVALEVVQKANFKAATHREDLARAANVQLCVDATVLRLVTDPGGRRVTGLAVSTATGKRLDVSARYVVLAAGGIENPRLLLLSRDADPAGLGNRHGQVGRYFMDHLSFTVGTYTPIEEGFRERYFSRWIALGDGQVRNSVLIAEKIRRQEQLLRCFFEFAPRLPQGAHGYKSAKHILDQLRHGRRIEGLREHVGNVIEDRDVLVPFARRKLLGASARPTPAGKPFKLTVSAEPSPNPDSRVTLASRTDRLGQPLARLDWRVAALDRDCVRRSLEILASETDRLGLGKVSIHPDETWSLHGHYHHIGTTRMSTDERYGVVDPHCRVHGVDNLYVAGSSVFPTAGAGTTTLLIVALALRLADELRSTLERDRKVPTGSGTVTPRVAAAVPASA